MKTKVKNIYFCPFEYNALEEYLRSMAAKGWMIKKIKYLRHVLVFNRCIPQDVHFYVDVSTEFSVLKEVDMPKRLEFRSFLEEYGYRFLFAYESLEIFITEQQNLPIWEERADIEKLVRKASWKSMLSNLLLACNPALLTCLSWKWNDWYLTDNVNLGGTLFMGMVAMSFIALCIPNALWLMHIKRKSTWKRVVHRSWMINGWLMLMFILLLACFQSLLALWGLLVILIVYGMYTICSHIKNSPIQGKRGRQCITIGAGIGILLVGVLSSQHYYANYKQDKEIMRSALQSKLAENTSANKMSVSLQESILLKRYEVEGMQYNEKEEIQRYHFLQVKDNFLHDLLMEKLCMQDGRTTIRTYGTYTIYKTKFSTFWVKGSGILEVLEQSGSDEQVSKEVDRIFNVFKER